MVGCVLLGRVGCDLSCTFLICGFGCGCDLLFGGVHLVGFVLGRRLLIDFVCIGLGGCLILNCWFGICIKCTFGLGFCGGFVGGLYGLLINGLLFTFCCERFVVCGWCILGVIVVNALRCG